MKTVHPTTRRGTTASFKELQDIKDKIWNLPKIIQHPEGDYVLTDKVKCRALCFIDDTRKYLGIPLLDYNCDEICLTYEYKGSKYDVDISDDLISIYKENTHPSKWKFHAMETYEASQGFIKKLLIL